jgi:hypothetical protein
MKQHTELTASIRVWQHCAVFLLACFVIISRRPDAVFNPQFRYEDGTVWYENAYQFGWWSALFHPWQGYFLTLPRLGAALALLGSLAHAPLVLAIVAVAVQALPVNILLCSRSSAWGTLRFRACLAAMFLALPIYGEMGAIMTCAHWFLALSAFLVVVASKPGNVGEWIFDFCILSLCGLSGPFCFLLLPMAIYLAWRRGNSRISITTGGLFAICLIQAWSLLILDPNGRPHGVPGANPVLFVYLLASKVFLGTLLGSNGLAVHPTFWVSVILSATAIGGTIFMVYSFIHTPIEMKLLIAFAGALFASALVSPTIRIPDGQTAWRVLAGLGESRYWFFSMLAFAWSILWFLRSRARVVRTISVILLCITSFGIIREWRQPALRDGNFPAYAREFEAAPIGAEIVIPESTDGWTLTLVKHKNCLEIWDAELITGIE